MTIDEMIAQDGFYEISNPMMARHGVCFLVEVENGVVHQLNRGHRRDGVLSRDGWGPDLFITKVDKPE